MNWFECVEQHCKKNGYKISYVLSNIKITMDLADIYISKNLEMNSFSWDMWKKDTSRFIWANVIHKNTGNLSTFFEEIKRYK